MSIAITAWLARRENVESGRTIARGLSEFYRGTRP